jgi:uncharacterized protein
VRDLDGGRRRRSSRVTRGDAAACAGLASATLEVAMETGAQTHTDTPGRALGPRALEETEVRVLGCLLEKRRTTPDAYPLSLNALRLACNQSTNRDPVVAYEESTVRDAVQRLQRRGLARLASGAGSRAAKFRHLLDDALGLGAGEEALMCVLMLRGAQTPGELKLRAERMHNFADLGSVHEALAQLAARGLVQSLPRRPGQKEERYAQLLAGEPSDDAAPGGLSAAPAPGVGGDGLAERVARLEREVAELRAHVGI